MSRKSKRMRMLGIIWHNVCHSTVTFVLHSSIVLCFACLFVCFFVVWYRDQLV